MLQMKILRSERPPVSKHLSQDPTQGILTPTPCYFQSLAKAQRQSLLAHLRLLCPKSRWLSRNPPFRAVMDSLEVLDLTRLGSLPQTGIKAATVAATGLP